MLLQVVSFDEFKLGAIVRVLKEKPHSTMQVDLTVVVTGKNADDAAKALRNLPDDSVPIAPHQPAVVPPSL